VRNHGGIPIINEDDYSVEISGMVNSPKILTLKDLKNENLFPRQTAVVTIQCSGTRRIEQIQQYPGSPSFSHLATIQLMTMQVTEMS